MDDFFINKDDYFKKLNIKADVKKGDILAPKQVQVVDVLFGKGSDKMINKMSDIFPQTERHDS